MFRKTTKRQKVEGLESEPAQDVEVHVVHKSVKRGTRNDWSTLTTPWQQAHSASEIDRLRAQLSPDLQVGEVSLDPSEVSRYSSVLQSGLDGEDFKVKREVEILAGLQPLEEDDSGVPMTGVKEQEEQFEIASEEEEAVKEWSESQMRNGGLKRQEEQLPALPRQDVTLEDLLNDIARLTESTASELAANQAKIQQLQALEAKTTQKVDLLTRSSLTHTETFVLFEEFKDYVETMMDCMEDCRDALELAVKRIEGQEVMETASSRSFRLRKWCAECEETLPMWQCPPPPPAPYTLKYEDVIDELFAEASEKYYDWEYIVRSFTTIRTALPHLSVEIDCEKLLRECVLGLANLETWTWSPFREGWDLQTLQWYTHLAGWPKVREAVMAEVLAQRIDFVLTHKLDIYDLQSVRRAVEGVSHLCTRKQLLLPLIKSQLEDLSAPSTPAGCEFILTVADTVLASLVLLAGVLPSGASESMVGHLLAGVYLSCLQEIKDEDVQRHYQYLLDALKPLETHSSAMRPIIAWVRFERPHLLSSLS